MRSASGNQFMGCPRVLVVILFIAFSAPSLSYDPSASRCMAVRSLCEQGDNHCDEYRSLLQRDGVTCQINDSDTRTATFQDPSTATSQDSSPTRRCAVARIACQEGNPHCKGYRYWLSVDGITCPSLDNFTANSNDSVNATTTPPVARRGSTERVDTIPLQRDGGTYSIAVVINDRITLNFVLDSGASDVTIPMDVVSTLMRTGTLTTDDVLDEQTYVLADGTKVPQRRIRIRSLRIGNLELHNIISSVGPSKGSLLLGQSFLSKLNSWTIDNQAPALLVR
jgi:clan AA aspartic protease (TIGR02281 family)